MKGEMPKNKKKIIIIVVIIIAVIAAAGFTAFYLMKDHYYSLMKYSKNGDNLGILSEDEANKLLKDFDDNGGEDSPEDIIRKLEEELEANADRLNAINPIGSKSVYNILLIGTDARKLDDRGRSDSMILVSINTERKKIFVTSFLRDIYVAIPGVGNNRLNAAYVYGGASLLMETIEQNFGIKIDNYMKTNFFSFIEIIDAIGTVDIEITNEEVQYMNRYIREVNQLMGVDKKGWSA